MQEEPTPLMPSLDEYIQSGAFQAHVAESNSDISHAEFVAGVRNATLGVRFIGEPSQLLRGAQKAPFHIFTLLYMLAPLVVIPVWAYYVGTWWLLLGIPVTYFAVFLAASKSKLIYLFTCLCIGVWFKLGFSIHQYITFHFLCATWGHIFFACAEESQNTEGLQALVNDADLFYRALAQNRILIFRNDANAT